MKEKIIHICRLIFGYGILLCLFAGGATFFGYIAAMFIGGSTAENICVFIYKTIMPIIIYTSTVLVLFGLLVMYLNGEKSLTPKVPKKN